MRQDDDDSNHENDSEYAATDVYEDTVSNGVAARRFEGLALSFLQSAVNKSRKP